MKLTCLSVTFWALVLVAFSLPLYAGNLGAGGTDPFILNFDENGHGSINQNNTGWRPDPGFLALDPLSGIVALAYGLPENVVPGDVGVQEFGLTGFLSDGLRFENNLYGFPAVMFYFSDPGDSALADTGFPLGFPCCLVQEHGIAESVDRFDWFPGGNVYHGLSDTPEPASIALLGSGILGLAGVLRRKLGR